MKSVQRHRRPRPSRAPAAPDSRRRTASGLRATPHGDAVALPLPVDELERRNLLAAATGGNKTRAARLLGIDRVTLYNRLRKHGADTE
jgi:transcriptional regulator of acetoin/glycerol metabolism